MFHEILDGMSRRMSELEAIDARDREDGTPRMKRLRQVPRETGRFIALLAASAPPGAVVEIGTSAGYSTMWLALACRETGRRLTTFEVLPEKVSLARKLFARRASRTPSNWCTVTHASTLQASQTSGSASSMPRRKSTRTAMNWLFPGL